MTNQKQAQPSRLEIFLTLFCFLGMLLFTFFSDDPMRSVFVLFFCFVYFATTIFSLNRVYTANKAPSSPPFPLGLSIHAAAAFLVLLAAAWIFEASRGWQIALLAYVVFAVFLLSLSFIFPRDSHP